MQMKSLLIFLVTLATSLPNFLAYQPIPLVRTRLLGFEPKRATTSTPNLFKDLKTYYYNQTLGHFTYSPESYRTFNQKYYVKENYWGGNNSPIFVYLGDEQALDDQIGAIGFLEEHAPQFKALIVYIEHRFYGRSSPLKSMTAAMKSPKFRGYLNSEQALADYAEIISDLKKRYGATTSPIIVFGVSYGGMLAAWFRLKYPHISLGAVASSAPVLKHIVSTDGYLQVVTKDYQYTSENCYKTIKESWTQIQDLGSQVNGLFVLNKKFNTCSPLSVQSIIYNFLFPIYTTAAQYDYPPYYPVAAICKGIDAAPKAADAIDKVYAGLLSLFSNITCFTGSEASQVPSTPTPSDSSLGWPWQTCSEMVFFGAVSVSINDTESMFPFIPAFDLNAVIQQCQAKYRVSPRPNWIETYYGGQDMKRVLKRFGSNIIFSNGLRDPYSSAGVLEDLSATLQAISTPQGSHGLDMRKTMKSDPQWLVAMRKTEVKTIKGWLTQYNADLSTQ